MENPKREHGAVKCPLGLSPFVAEVEMAWAFAEGAEKYGAYNWRATGVDAMTYISAIRRHLGAWAEGEDRDPDGCHNVSHLGKIMACCAILLDVQHSGQLEDNRPGAEEA